MATAFCSTTCLKVWPRFLVALPNAAPFRIYSCLKRRKTSAQPIAQSCLVMIWHDGCSFLGPVPPFPGGCWTATLVATAFCSTTCLKVWPRFLVALPNAAPFRIYSCLKRRKTSAQPIAQSYIYIYIKIT